MFLLMSWTVAESFASTLLERGADRIKKTQEISNDSLYNTLCISLKMQMLSDKFFKKQFLYLSLHLGGVLKQHYHCILKN